MSKQRNLIKAGIGIFLSLWLAYTLVPTYQKRFKKRLKVGPVKSLEPVIYLTFDDGPSNYTPELLKLLAEYQVKATFFVVGDFVKQYPEIVKQTVAAGHEIGLHSEHHINAMLQTPQATKKDFQATKQALLDLGIEPHFYRPPWGQFNLATAKQGQEVGTELILWDVMAEDWRASSTSQMIANKLRKRIYPGVVICLHDGRGRNQAPRRTIAALREVIPELLAQGYEFKLVSEMPKRW